VKWRGRQQQAPRRPTQSIGEPTNTLLRKIKLDNQ
jgi:hypothetical protein